MQNELETLTQLSGQLSQEEYLLIGILILSLLVSIYLYSLFRKQKKQQVIAENKVEIFQKTFDVSQDPTLILSDKNEILYANRTMVKLFKLKRNFLTQKLSPIPQIKLKESWLPLDIMIEENEGAFKEHTLSFQQVDLRFEYEEGIPINLHLQRSEMKEKRDKVLYHHFYRGLT